MRLPPEKRFPLLNFISNVVIILLLILSIGYIVIVNEYRDFEKRSKKIERELRSEFKRRLKTEVDRVADYINYYKSLSQERLKKEVRERVEHACQIINAIYNKYHEIEPKEKVQERIIDALEPLRWNNGYSFLWIIDTNGIAVLFPINPKIENQSVLSYRDSKGKKVVEEAINIGLNFGEGFIEKIFVPSPDRKNLLEQIAYVKLFKPYDWIIGSGETVSGVEKDIKEDVLKRIGCMRFNENGYFGVIDESGTVLSHPFIKKGTSLNAISSGKYKNIAQKILKIAEYGGFTQYYFRKLNENKIAKKLVYAKKIPDWNWVVFSGVYLDEIEAKIKKSKQELTKELRNRIAILLAIFAVFTFLALMVSFFFSKKLQNIFDNYRKKIEYRTRRLERLNKILKEKERQALAASKAKTLFISNISHDIRTPLNAILGYAQLLEKDPSLRPEQREKVEKIIKHGNLLLELLDEVIEISKIESGKIEANEECFDLKTFLENIYELFEPRAREKGLEWRIESGLETTTYVTGDKKKLFHVLINLVSNAIKYTDKGEIVLKVERIGNDRYRFSVIDTGIGIEKDDQQYIFDIFTQAKGGTNRGGKGLGLAIASRYVQIMGGKLDLSSEANVGSRFFFEITLKEGCTLSSKNKSKKRKQTPPDSNSAKNLRIDSQVKEEILRLTEIGNFTKLKETIEGLNESSLKQELQRYIKSFDLKGLQKFINDIPT
jgi:signal transduction histidine kinase